MTDPPPYRDLDVPALSFRLAGLSFVMPVRPKPPESRPRTEEARMNLKWILDPEAGNRLRAYLWWVASLLVIAGQVLDDLEAAGWAITPAFLISLVAHLTKFGNRPPDRS